MNTINKLLIIIVLVVGTTAWSQETLTMKQVDSLINLRIKAVEKNQKEQFSKLPKVQLRGMMQTRFVSTLTENVDLNGLHTDGAPYTNNSFDVKRFRLGGRFALDEKIEVGFLANFADFKSNPTTKFLENAFLRYKHNKFLNITVGQFRPVFGIEDSNEVEVCRSFDFSNQYYETGSNAWQSFQVGLQVTGETTIASKNLSYSFAVINGNGRNPVFDNTNGKLFINRMLLELSKKYNLKVGTSAGIGNEWNQKTYVLGLDLKADVPLSKNLLLELQLEGRQGVNHALFGKIPLAQQTLPMDYYQMRGVYFLPNFKYFVSQKYLHAIEFSCRLEYWDSNFKINSNAKKTFTPMLSFEIFKDYAGRISTGVQMDRFQKNIPKTSIYDNNLFIMQFQARF